MNNESTSEHPEKALHKMTKRSRKLAPKKPAKQQAFLDAIAICGTVKQAAIVTGIAFLVRVYAFLILVRVDMSRPSR